MNAVEIGPVPPERRTQTALDLFWIFAGANIVATTLVTGASLPAALGLPASLILAALGTLLGSALVAALAPVGPRLGVPSVIAARAALGRPGAALLALTLCVTNFAWIALNDVIAASACRPWLGGAASERACAFGLGVLATAVVAGGPKLVGLADRLAVPLMLGVGVLMTAALAGRPLSFGHGSVDFPSLLRGLDLVIGYQVSWILMFADYSRYTASTSRGAAAVFLGLALTSLWFMPLGLLAAHAARSADPGAAVAALGLGGAGALLLALGTLTTNFVNVYLSALAWKSLVPRASEQASVWSIGLLGALLSLFSRGWLERYAEFMLLLGGILVPAGAVLLAGLVLRPEPVEVAALYAEGGRYAGWRRRGLAAWAVGAVVYFACAGFGGTLPSLLAALLTYTVLARLELA